MKALFCMLGGFGLLVAADLFQVDRPSPLSWKRTRCGSPAGAADIPSRWGANVTADKQPLPEYPRPQMVRGQTLQFDSESLRKFRDTGGANWQNLNGLWQWEAAMGASHPPFGHDLAHSLLVPFPVESCLSGMAPQSSDAIVKMMWYRLIFTPTAVDADTKLLLHFGAVDWQTQVWVNTKSAGAMHTGGYDGFSYDITSLVVAGKNELMVYVHDPSDSGVQPNGKQRITAISKPGSDTYTPSSGIWQTVWFETVPTGYISNLRLNGDATSLKVTANFTGTAPGCSFQIMDNGKVVAKKNGGIGQEVTIPVPSPKLWSPTSPFLYDLQVNCGKDQVMAYFGMRTFTLKDVLRPAVPPTGPQPGIDRGGFDMPGSPFQLPSADPNLCWAACNKTAACHAWSYAVPGCDSFKNPMCWLKSQDSGARTPYKCRVSGTQGVPAGNVKRPVLNGKFKFMVGFLDQSWWPDGQYTAPADEGLKSDITATKMFGMNMIRLHQKVNSDRWYYHADTVGIAVMQDMPQKYGGATADTLPLFVEDLKAMINGRGNHPSIIQWETFNEGDCVGVFNKAKPYMYQDIVDLVRKTDWQNRLLDFDSGGPANAVVGDVNDIHTYPYPKDPKANANMYAMVGEFGGMGYFQPGKEWVPGGCFAYVKSPSSGAQANLYITMVGQLYGYRDDVSASVYTQTTDLENECDGFLNYDRTNKFTAPATRAIAAANQELING